LIFILFSVNFISGKIIETFFKKLNKIILKKENEFLTQDLLYFTIKNNKQEIYKC